MRVFILGAGPAGLALAHGLSQDSNMKIVLIEAHPQVGGLAQTLEWNNDAHDLGPHKLFTLDKELERRVHDLLPESGWLRQPKRSRIYINGHFLPYPPSPFSLIRVFGPFTFLKMILGFVKAKFSGSAAAGATFESDLVSRMGRPLYSVLFQPIALKLWGDPTQLDSKLSQGRVQTPSVMQLVMKTLGFKNATETSEALEYFYPKGGLQKLWNSLVSRLKNAAVMTGHQVVGIDFENKRVTRLRLKEKETGEEKELVVGMDDKVVSTLPLTTLTTVFQPPMPEETKKAIRDLVVLNDLLLVFLKIDREKLTPDSWIFIPDPEVAFHRVSDQASFDPGMSSGGSIVCCEIMSHELRPFAKKTDKELKDICVAGLKKMGFDVKTADSWASRVIRLPASYPVYRPNSAPRLQEILNQLDTYENFRTVGRQGSFNYIGSLDAMDIGYGAARWVLKNKLADAQSWQAERQRTLQYPVLD